MCGRHVFIFYQKFDYLIIDKKKMSILVILGLDTHISDAKTKPFFVFGPVSFAYLKHVGVQIKGKLTCNTASGFLLFGKNAEPKKPFCESSPLPFLGTFLVFQLVNNIIRELPPLLVIMRMCAIIDS